MSYSERKRVEEQKQKKQMQRLIWITGIIIAVVVALVWVGSMRSEKPVSIALDNLPVLGNKSAQVQIVEYGDFKCPSCQYFSQQIMPQLKKEYVDTGKVAVYFSNYPFIGSDSFTAAYAGQAIYHQNNDAFWTFYDTVYKNQQDEKTIWATPDVLVKLAQDAKLPINFDQLKKDIDDKTYKSEVDKQYNTGYSHGVDSTPTLFINGVKFTDFSNYNALKQAIDQAQKAK
jgi:protein-disulfide isomerase